MSMVPFPPQEKLVEDQRFSRIVQPGASLRDLRFEQCTFDHCDFSKADFGKTRFTACTFIGCDLSMMKLTGSSLQQVAFQECKLLGVDFSVSSAMLFSITCTDCPMDHAVFEARVMPEVTFKRCSLRGAVFERGDLQGAVLDDCDLSDAAFDGADLRKADLTTAYHLRIDPRATNMRGARVSTDGALDLLSVFGVVVE